MSDVQIAIDVKFCVANKVSPEAFEQKLRTAITALELTVEIENHAVHSNILGMHPVGCSELVFSPDNKTINKHSVYEEITSIFNSLKQ
jgi:hypothetical protein